MTFKIGLFVEDYAHRAVIGALVRRLANEKHIQPDLAWLNARHGLGAVGREFAKYLNKVVRRHEHLVDLLVVATDANCMGFSNRRQQLVIKPSPMSTVYAIPDPHVERWLLLDGAAFKTAIGRGCQAPDKKCARNRYKQLLAQEIRHAGIDLRFGGIEFAEDIVNEIDIERAASADPSFRHFVKDFRAALQREPRVS